MQQTQENKPTVMNMDKAYKNLTPTECFYLLNFQNYVLLNANKKGNNISQGNEFPANFPACEIDQPAGEVNAVKSYYSARTNELYSFHYNNNGVHYILRIAESGCDIVYAGACLPLSADPKREVTQFRAWLKYDRTCRNQHGKVLYFVTGDFEGAIDVEASIATNYFTTPFFDRCSDGCEPLQLCVPDPQVCPIGYIPLLTEAERVLPNYLMDTGFQFKFRHVYYDFRASIWSKTSTLFYQNSLALGKAIMDFGRKIVLRIPAGGPQVDKIEIAVSENNGNTWRKIAVIDKYKKYNDSQEKWYERDLAELTGYSDDDCSFDFTFYNDTIGETVPQEEINRNFNPHPRGAQGLFPFKNSLAYYNYIKGNCPIDKIQSDKLRVSVKPNCPGLREGLKAGGKYGFGFIITGDCGRFSFVAGSQILEIPRSQEQNVRCFHTLLYDATGMILPDWAKRVDIVRTKNLNGFELQWVVDKITREDGKIKITIQSLHDHNEKYAFKTNTVYQFVEGDRIEFIKNGGNLGFFQPVNTDGILNYKVMSPFVDDTLLLPQYQPEDFFNTIILKDDGRLNALQIGAIIELQRPKKVVDNLPYYEICSSLEVSNQRLVNETGEFNTFDSYLITRTMGIYQDVEIEHHSPNDLWPVRVSDIGRTHVASQYEDEKRYGRNITVNAENQYNWFGDFEKTMPAPEQGDITAIGLYDGKVGVTIGEHDYFLFQLGDDFVRIGAGGVLTAAPVDSLISDPEQKISGMFGCQYDHIGSVLFGDGFVSWVDVNRHAFAICDFSSAKDAALGKAQTYFRKRCQEIETHNRSAVNDIDKYRFSTGYNKHDEYIMLTLKKLRDGGINNSIRPFDKPNDTIAYSPSADEFLGFISFTPEAYGYFNLFDGNGSAFVTYLNGVPYFHPIKSDKFNEFFGITVDQVIGFSINKFPEKIKRGLAMEIQSEMLFFSEEITTDNDKFLSEIPPAMVIKDGRKWNAPFLYNKNSIGGLFNSDKNIQSEDTRGYYINVLFVRDNTDGLKYGTIDIAKRVKHNQVDSILSKFYLVEQSGYTQNL